jgi:hypothetical protein
MLLAWAYVKGLLKPRPCAYVLRFAFPYDLLCCLFWLGFGYGLQVASLFVCLAVVAFGWWACLLSIALLLGFIGCIVVILLLCYLVGLGVLWLVLLSFWG